MVGWTGGYACYPTQSFSTPPPPAAPHRISAHAGCVTSANADQARQAASGIGFSPDRRAGGAQRALLLLRYFAMRPAKIDCCELWTEGMN